MASTFANFFKMISTPDVDSRPSITEAEELGFVYVTDRIVAMPFPSEETLLTGERVKTQLEKSQTLSKLANYVVQPNVKKYSNYFNKHLRGKYMIWNISEKTYDYSLFDNQVIEVKFPGYPAPPIQKILEICTSIDGWLQADEKNVAVIHCQTMRGRTVTMIAAYLTWSGEFSTPARALRHTCTKMRGAVRQLTLPTQTRYMAYLTRLLVEKKMPNVRPIRIERIVFHTVPKLEKEGEKNGCRPYVQIFKDGKLLYTSRVKGETVKMYSVGDVDTIKFKVMLEVEGDLLIRVRHSSMATHRSTSMFRFGLHTGYSDRQGVVRFKKSQLDCAWDCKLFEDDFWVDLLISEPDKTDKPEILAQEAFWADVEKRLWARAKKADPTSKKTQQAAALDAKTFTVGDDSEMSSEEEEDVNLDTRQSKEDIMVQSNALFAKLVESPTGTTGTEKENTFADLEKYVENLEDDEDDQALPKDKAELFDALLDLDDSEHSDRKSPGPEQKQSPSSQPLAAKAAPSSSQSDENASTSPLQHPQSPQQDTLQNQEKESSKPSDQLVKGEPVQTISKEAELSKVELP